MALLGMWLVASGCRSDDATSDTTLDDRVRIGGFDFAESELLVELYAQILEAQGIPVERLGPVGPREIVAPALELGQLDLVPEYLGTMAQFFQVNTESGASLDELSSDTNHALEARGLVALSPAEAEDTNVFVVTNAFSDQYDVNLISELAPLAPELRFGGPPECPDRPLCLVGLRRTYGIEFRQFVPQRSLRVTAEALRRGEIDVGLLFSTAPELGRGDLKLLGDDRVLQPRDNVVPLVRREVLDRWEPELSPIFDALAPVLTTRELRTMNARVARGEPVPVVVSSWLEGEGLVTPQPSSDQG